MTLVIDCGKASEYITSAVDDRLPLEERKLLEVHLIQCRICRVEMELERRTKAALKSSVAPVRAPSHLREKIEATLESELSLSGRTPGRSGILQFFTPARMLAFGGAAAAVLAGIWLFGERAHNHTRPSDGNIVTEAFNKYDDLIEGKLSPQIHSDNRDAVRSFLSRNVSFPTNVPPMQEFTLVGATLTVADQETVAHIIYRWQDTYVYIEESDARKIAPGRRSRFIPSRALDDLQRSGWHFDGNLVDCTLAMWLEDSTLCTAVGDVDKQMLLANITGMGR